MSLNRREMLRLGAVGAGGVMLSSAASSVGLAFDRLPAPPPLPPPLAPLAPRSRLLRASTRMLFAARQGGARCAAPDRCARLHRHRRFLAARRREPRFHVVHLPAAGRKPSRRPRPRLRPRPFGLSRALLQRVRLLRDVERHLHDRRLLSRQVWAFDEGPRARLVEQQRRAARHRHPQRLVRRAGR